MTTEEMIQRACDELVRLMRADYEVFRAKLKTQLQARQIEQARLVGAVITEDQILRARRDDVVILPPAPRDAFVPPDDLSVMSVKFRGRTTNYLHRNHL